MVPPAATSPWESCPAIDEELHSWCHLVPPSSCCSASTESLWRISTAEVKAARLNLYLEATKKKKPTLAECFFNFRVKTTLKTEDAEVGGRISIFLM